MRSSVSFPRTTTRPRTTRFFWLQAKLADADAGKTNETNPFRFEPLKPVPCDAASLTAAVHAPWPYKVAGMLFYHKEGIYTPGSSPTALWLPAGAVEATLGAYFAALSLGTIPSASALSGNVAPAVT